jgi:inosose dehydratase
MNVRIGTAPDSWGVWFPNDPKQPPWDRFLDEVGESGYEWIELGPPGYLPTHLPVLKRELDERGLKVSATVVMRHLEDPAAWPQIERDVRAAGFLLSSLRAQFLVLVDDFYTDLLTGRRKGPSCLDEDGWMRLIEATHKVAELAHDRFELRTVFHPHCDTHVEYEGQIERFLEQTDPTRVGLCLDTGHHAYRGGDPVAFMRRHHRRIQYLHLKSIDRDIQKKVERDKIPYSRAVAMQMFCEPSQGAVDFTAFRDVLQEVDYDGWAIVEQDMYPAPFDKPLPIAKRTREYLRNIGIG